MEMMVKDLAAVPGTFPDGFSGEFCQIFKKKMIWIFYKPCQLTEGKKEIVLKLYRTSQEKKNLSHLCA